MSQSKRRDLSFLTRRKRGENQSPEIKRVFEGYKNEEEFKNVSFITKIKIPHFKNTVDRIKNKPPVIVSDDAVGIGFKRETEIYNSINDINIDRISNKKTGSKYKTTNSYTVEELRTIAKNLGIYVKNIKKSNIATLILEKIDQLKSVNKK